jgi:hypothetical protein
MHTRWTVFAIAMSFLVAGSASGEDKLKKAKNQVDNIRQPDPPKVSTTTKPNPVGQRVTSTSKEPGYKPQQPPVRAKPVPSPAK